MEVASHQISVAFNTGEYRVIDFEKLFDEWQITPKSFEGKLLDPDFFAGVELREGTLGWPGLVKKIALSNGSRFEAPYELDPLVLYEASEPDEVRNQRYYLGGLLKKARKEAGLTQEELAKRSGTTKNHISRIENNRSDIELGTLRKIIEIGLDKKLEITVS